MVVQPEGEALAPEGMTEAYADNPKVFGRWQSRMLETHEAAQSMAQLLMRPADELNLGNFKLGVSGEPEDISLAWSPIFESPISPSISDFGVSAATESITIISMAPERIR